MKYNVELHLNYFSVNAFILAVVFRQQIKKTPTVSGKTVGFLEFVGEIQQLVRKRSQKNN